MFRKVFGVSFFRWTINGIVFIFFVIVIAIFGMMSFGFYRHHFREADNNSAGYCSEVSDLKHVEPRLHSFINENPDKDICLLFIDFNCNSCVKFWKSVENRIEAVEKRMVPVLITSNPSNDTPLRYLLYDKRNSVIRFFGLQTDPAGIIIKDMEISEYLNSPEEILKWVSSLSEKEPGK